jgi:tripartite-type tricarboxylate transporter receptor subunit TctC
MHALQSALFAAVVTMGVAVAVPAGIAQAQQKFPSKPVRIVVPNPAGSQGDILARMIGQKMSEGWGQTVVVENRTGGVGTLAAGTVAKAAPDGHTLLHTAGFAVNAALQSNLPYDPLKDFAGVTQIGFGTQVLVVAPALGAKSVKDFIALAKAQPSVVRHK